jgi:hypothetical protein
MIKTQPKHQPKRQGMLRRLEDLCSQATTTIEGQLKAQEEGDAASRRQREEEEYARQAAERKEQEHLERVQLKVEWSMIEAAECELMAKKKALKDKEKALKDVQKVVDPSDDDNDEIDEDNENDGSEHTPEQQAVRYHLFILLFFAHSTTIC